MNAGFSFSGIAVMIKISELFMNLTIPVCINAEKKEKE